MHMLQVYRDAWTREKHETKGQYRRDAFVSLVGPTLVLWALWETCGKYGEDYPMALAVSTAALLMSLVVMEMGCCALTRGRSNGRQTAPGSENDSAEEPPRGSPMLAFAVLLFSTGAAFTVVEIFDYFLGPIGILNPNAECAANPHPIACPKRLDFDSPWGDFLLGFSALCMLAEEFSLFNTYNAVRKEVRAARRQLEQAEREKRRIASLGQLAQEKYKQVEECWESTKQKQQKTEECLNSTGRMRKQAVEHLNGVKKLHDAALDRHRSMRSSEGKLARRIAIRAAFYVLALQVIVVCSFLAYLGGI